MGFDRPDKNTLIFECDACPAQFERLENHEPSFVVTWKGAQELGWITLKPQGQPWEHFCPGCADIAREEVELNRNRERERERLKERNSRYRGE
jgi:ribosomal protein L44E